MTTDLYVGGRTVLDHPELTVHVYVNYHALYEDRVHREYAIGPNRILQLARVFGRIVCQEVFYEAGTASTKALYRFYESWTTHGFRILIEPSVRVYSKNSQVTIRTANEHSQMVNTLINGFRDSIPDVVILVAHHQVPPAVIHSMLDKGIRVVFFKTTVKEVLIEHIFSHSLCLSDWADESKGLPENPFQNDIRGKIKDLFRYVDQAMGCSFSSFERLAGSDPEGYQLLKQVLNVSSTEDLDREYSRLEQRVVAGDKLPSILRATLLALAAIPRCEKGHSSALVLETDHLWQQCLDHRILIDYFGRWAIHILVESGLLYAEPGGTHPDDSEYCFSREYDDPIHELARRFVEKYLSPDSACKDGIEERSPKKRPTLSEHTLLGEHADPDSAGRCAS